MELKGGGRGQFAPAHKHPSQPTPEAKVAWARGDCAGAEAPKPPPRGDPAKAEGQGEPM